MKGLWLLVWFLVVFPTIRCAVLDFETLGGIPVDSSHTTCKANTERLSQVLQYNASDNTIVFNKLFHFFNGVYAHHLKNVKLIIDGTLRFERPPVKTVDHPPACILIDKSKNITVTSSKRGLIDGRGSNYWGVPVVGFLELVERRPRLFRMNQTSDILIENVVFKDSPYHTVYLESVNNTVVRNISIVARRTPADGHSWVDLSAFNTDGLDISGRNVHVHDVDIWTQDDCIAVKDNMFGSFTSENMLFERVNCSGLGIVLGSIGGTIVRNITFRDSYLHKSVKGIYAKFHTISNFWRDVNRTHGLMEDIHFENIVMERPLQWPIWFGPAQQADGRSPCHPNPCSLCWPQDPVAECHVVGTSRYRNITLSNIRINRPKMSPGVILGGQSAVNDIENILFANVTVTHDPPIYPNFNRSEAFPGLLQPIHDKFVPRSMVIHNDEELCGFCWILGLCNVFVIFLLWEVSRPTGRSDSSESTLRTPLLSPGVPRRTRRVAILRFCTGILLLLTIDLFAWQVKKWNTPKWDRTDRYFRCTGVVNGTATNGTWPVPGCFTEL